MSPRQRSARDAIVNAVIGAVAALVIAQGVPGAWHSKETVTAHNADLQSVNTKIDRVLDLLCAPQPEARACKIPSAAQVAQR